MIAVLVSFIVSACDKKNGIDDDNILKNEKATISITSADVSTVIIEKELSDWQRAYADYFKDYDMSSIQFLYIDDINGDGIPEVFNSGDILYYSKGEIKSFGGYFFMFFCEYLPETNQIVTFYNGINGGRIITFYSYNADTEDYETDNEYKRYSKGGCTLNDEEIDMTDEEFYRMYDELHAASFDFTPLTLEDVGDDFTAYFEEKLFFTVTNSSQIDYSETTIAHETIKFLAFFVIVLTNLPFASV